MRVNEVANNKKRNGKILKDKSLISKIRCYNLVFNLNVDCYNQRRPISIELT